MHRREIGKLLAAADAIFTTTASQAAHLRCLRPGAQIEVLPVGSNICPPASSDNARPTGHAVLFGLQGGRLRALRTMANDLRALAAAGHLRKIITLGGGNEPGADEEERGLLLSLGLALGFEQLGSRSEAEISAQLSSAAFGISAQDKLSLTKSGTFMAYAAHGLCVLSPAANGAGGEPFSCLVSPAELLHGVSGPELAQRARCLKEWQERNASWAHLAERFAASLQIATVKS